MGTADEQATNANSQHCQAALRAHGVDAPIISVGDVDHLDSNRLGTAAAAHWFLQLRRKAVTDMADHPTNAERRTAPRTPQRPTQGFPPGIPKQVQASYRLWLVAVAAGVFETALVVVEATSGAVGSAAEVAVGVAVRLLVFTAAVYLAARLRTGRNWARVALAVLLGGIGTLSLVIGPVTWLTEGGSFADALAAADLGSVLFAASRVVHLGAVIAAVLLMFHPAANAYVRAATR
jgi:hypothetical protein